MYNNFVPTRAAGRQIMPTPLLITAPFEVFRPSNGTTLILISCKTLLIKDHTHNHAHGISCLLVRRIQNWFYLSTYFILLGHPNKSFRNWWILHCPYIQSNSAISTDWMVKVVQVWENNHSTRVGSDSKKKRLSLQIKASVGALN